MNSWMLWMGRLLMLSGAFLILAVVPLFFPFSLMSKIHTWLGLGEMPDDAITLYLARSTSAMYFIHGIVMFFTGLKVKELWSMVKILGILHIVIGSVMLYVDLNAGMPTYWTVAEGPPVACLGILILYMWQRGTAADSSIPNHQE